MHDVYTLTPLLRVFCDFAEYYQTHAAFNISPPLYPLLIHLPMQIQ